MDRRQLQRLHARRRATERYGLELTNADITQIVSLIRHQGSIRTKKLTNTRTMHIIVYNEQEMKVIYDNKRHNVCTFFAYGNQIK